MQRQSEWDVAVVHGGANAGAVTIESNTTVVNRPGMEQLAVQPVERQSLIAPPSALQAYVTGQDLSATYWIPDSTRGERGLLEYQQTRPDGSNNYLPVVARPTGDLANNFSLPDGRRLSLDHDIFRMSKTARAFGQLDRIDDAVMMRGSDVREGLKSNLPNLHTDEFYLVRHRDYSTWAVKNTKLIPAKSDTFLGPKYVETCYAVRVGQNAGVLIPITEAQLTFGWEKIQARRVEVTPTLAQNELALTSDEFGSLGVALPPSGASNSTLDEAGSPRYRGHREEAYTPPHPWDWRPSAAKKRFDHYLEQQYQSVGRAVVKTAVVGISLWVGYQFLRSYLGFYTAPVAAPRRTRRQRGGGGDGEGMSGVLRGMKTMFDIALAPVGSGSSY